MLDWYKSHRPDPSQGELVSPQISESQLREMGDYLLAFLTSGDHGSKGGSNRLGRPPSIAGLAGRAVNVCFEGKQLIGFVDRCQIFHPRKWNEVRCLLYAFRVHEAVHPSVEAQSPDRKPTTAFRIAPG